MCVGKGREGERGLKLRMTVIIITRKNHLKNKHYTHFSTDDVYKPMHVSSCTKIPLSLPPPSLSYLCISASLSTASPNFCHASLCELSEERRGHDDDTHVCTCTYPIDSPLARLIFFVNWTSFDEYCFSISALGRQRDS